MQYLFGMHPVLEAVKAGKKFDKVLLKQGLEGAQFRYLFFIYSSIARAALRPAPIAKIIVAAPVTASPPAKIPGRVVAPFSSATIPP